MNFIKCEKLEKSMAELQFSVDAEAFKAAVADVFKKEGRKYSVPGFRKGKAPRKMIEAMYELGVYDAKEKLQQVKKFLRESKEESRDYTHGQAQQQTAVTQQT